MTIDAIIGNPPYQVLNQGNGNGANPIYHKFLDMAMGLSNQGTLIHPARFLFNAGKTPKEWNDKILNNEHFKVVDYWANSTEVFPTVDVKGGIATSYWNKKKFFGKIGFFSAFEELRSILAKVSSYVGKTLCDIVEPRELYRITDALYVENPTMQSRQSKGHTYSLGANIFEIFPELFFDEYNADKTLMVCIYGRYNNQRCFKWCKSTYITQPKNFNKYKVLVPEANGTGAIGEVLSAPVIVEPIVGYTDTFIGIGRFDSKKEADACMKYIKSKFARTLLGTLKATQHNPRDTWANIPLQNFTADSDIDWSQSIENIDKQLYNKYDLTKEEVAFIKKMIRPME